LTGGESEFTFEYASSISGGKRKTKKPSIPDRIKANIERASSDSMDPMPAKA
jgi:hypothetical protein